MVTCVAPDEHCSSIVFDDISGVPFFAEPGVVNPISPAEMQNRHGGHFHSVFLNILPGLQFPEPAEPEVRCVPQKPDWDNKHSVLREHVETAITEMIKVDVGNQCKVDFRQGRWVKARQNVSLDDHAYV